MSKKRFNPVVMSFFVFIILVVVIIVGAIAVLPEDIAFREPFNTSANIMNSGRVAPGKDIMFFAAEDGGVYNVFNDTKTKISEDKAEYIYATDDGPVYLSNGNLYSTFNDGSFKTTLLENIRYPMVIGRWVYYVGSEGEFKKYRIDDGKSFSLGIKPKNGNYYISVSTLFYIGDDDRFYTAKTDGSKIKPAFDDKDITMKDFMIMGNIVFYLNLNDELCFVEYTPDATAKMLGKVDSVNMVGSSLVFAVDSKLYSAKFSTAANSLDELDPVELKTGTFKHLSADDTYIYYFDEQNRLIRMMPDGSSEKIV